MHTKEHAESIIKKLQEQCDWRQWAWDYSIDEVDKLEHPADSQQLSQVSRPLGM